MSPETATASTLGTALRYAAEQFLLLADQADREGTPLEYLTPGEVAEALKVSRQTVHRWIKSGRLEAVKVGDLYRIPVDAVRELGE